MVLSEVENGADGNAERRQEGDNDDGINGVVAEADRPDVGSGEVTEEGASSDAAPGILRRCSGSITDMYKQ